MKDTHRVGALTFEIPLGSAAVQLFPAGTFDAPRGAMLGNGPWHLTAESAAQIIASAATRKNDILVDYEHQSVMAGKNGQPVPAAGWIAPTALSFDPAKGLVATAVAWAQKAKDFIAADEYRYISPVFIYEAATGVVVDLISVALTNQPAIDGMDKVSLAAAAQAYFTQQENPMDEQLLARLRGLLNLAATATAADIAAELAKLDPLTKPTAGAASIGLVAILGLKNAEIAQLQSAKPDPALYAPVAALTAVQQELAALSAEKTAREVDDLVKPALAEGRLLPAQEQWARDLGKSNPAALSEFLKTAQPIAALSGTQTGGKAPGTATGALSNAQIANKARAYHKAQTDNGVAMSFADAVDAVNQGLDTGAN